jgi:hypothetical protein
MPRRSPTWPVLVVAFTLGFARPTSVAAVSTECNLFQDSHICPTTSTYGDVDCGVAISPVRLYCKTEVTAVNPEEPVPDNLFENCNRFDSEGEDCCLAPTETGGIRLINMDNLYYDKEAPGPTVYYVLADFDFVTPGDPVFDVTIRGVQLSPFDFKASSIKATTCSDTKVRIASLRLYIEANHDLDEFTVTVAARDGRVSPHSTTFTLFRPLGGVSQINYTPKIRKDVSVAGTIRSASNRTEVIYNPTTAPTLTPTTFAQAAVTSAPSATSSTNVPQQGGDGGIDVSFVVVAGLAVAFCFGMVYFASKSRGKDNQEGNVPHGADMMKPGLIKVSSDNPLDETREMVGGERRSHVGARKSLLGYLLWGDRWGGGRSDGTGSDTASQRRGRRRHRAEAGKSGETAATFETRATNTSYLWSGSFTSMSTASTRRFFRGSYAKRKKEEVLGDDTLNDVELRDY